MTALSWDTTGPLHACRCDRVESLVAAAGVGPHLLSDVVAGELTDKGAAAACDHFETRGLDSMQGLGALARWVQRMGSDLEHGHDVGEAGAATLAELTGAIAVIDDRDAQKVATSHGLEAHGVLWAISRTVVDGTVPSPSAHSGLCDQMLGTKIRWPFGPGGYASWFLQNRQRLL